MNMSDTAHQPDGVIPPIRLGKRLEIAREHAGLNQEELAAILGKNSRTIISKMETGKQVPSRADVIVWALACGVQFAWLAGDDYPASTRRPGEGGGPSTIWSTSSTGRHRAWRNALVDLVS
jgi:DNA-binding XRE family transcriptional regulator